MGNIHTVGPNEALVVSGKFFVFYNEQIKERFLKMKKLYILCLQHIEHFRSFIEPTIDIKIHVLYLSNEKSQLIFFSVYTIKFHIPM